MNLAMTMTRRRWVMVFVLFFGLLFWLIVVWTGSRTPGELAQSRFGGQAHILADSKLLMMGGYAIDPSDQSILTSVLDRLSVCLNKSFPGVAGRLSSGDIRYENARQFEVFDPDLNCWSFIGDEAEVRNSLSVGHNRILLLNSHSEVSIYDVSKRLFEKCENLGRDVFLSNWVLLDNGKVLIVFSDHFSYFSIEYDLNLKKPDVASLRKMVVKPTGGVPRLQLLDDGRVMSCNEPWSPSSSPEYEVYESTRKTWCHLWQPSDESPEIPVVLRNGMVLIICENSGNCQLLDPKNGLLAPCSKTEPAQQDSRFNPCPEDAAVLLEDGRVLHINGPCQIYDPLTNKWSPTGSIHVLRQSYTATLLKNGKVLVAGGWVNHKPIPNCELYDPATGTWTEL